MRKNLKQESYQLFHRWGAWILLCLAFLGCFLMAKSTPVGAERWHARIDSKCIMLMTKAEAEWHVEWYTTISHNRVDKELIGLGDRYGLPSGSVKNGAEIYAALSEAEYTRLMWFEGGLLCFCIMFPAILISYPLDRGVLEWSAKLCGSRRKAAHAKVLTYYLLALVFSVVYTVLLIVIYARYIFSRQGIGYVLGTLAVHTLMEVAILSIPLYIAFLCKNTFLILGFNTAYGVLCYAVNVAAHYQDGVLFIPFPAWLHGLRSLWQPDGPKLWLAASALFSLAWILVFGRLSVRHFARAGK